MICEWQWSRFVFKRCWLKIHTYLRCWICIFGLILVTFLRFKLQIVIFFFFIVIFPFFFFSTFCLVLAIDIFFNITFYLGPFIFILLFNFVIWKNIFEKISKFVDTKMGLCICSLGVSHSIRMMTQKMLLWQLLISL